MTVTDLDEISSRINNRHLFVFQSKGMRNLFIFSMGVFNMDSKTYAVSNVGTAQKASDFHS